MTSSSSVTRGHLNDLTIGLGQQMFFWGRDVLAEGNLLQRYGFEKRVSPGLQGTSCYCKSWQQGVIELHGACAGWYPCQRGGQGFLFIRKDRRCYTHRETRPAVPGRYDYARLASGDLTGLSTSSRVFTAWLEHYETWIQGQMGAEYRLACFEMYDRLPSVRPWLSPTQALQWFSLFAKADPDLPRARHWLKKHSV